MMMDLEFVLNGQAVKTTVETNVTLLDMLRDHGLFGLTGTKKGCNRGECGACTVLLDGKAVNACLILAPQAAGKQIMTIEGLGTPDNLHPLQQSFVDHLALQCGYCGPGMLMSAKALLDGNPNPSEEQVRRAITGNLCRCTGYTKITQAILDVAKSA